MRCASICYKIEQKLCVLPSDAVQIGYAILYVRHISNLFTVFSCRRQSHLTDVLFGLIFSRGPNSIRMPAI